MTSEQNDQFPLAKLVLVVAIIGVAVAGWLVLRGKTDPPLPVVEPKPEIAEVVAEPEPELIEPAAPVEPAEEMIAETPVLEPAPVVPAEPEVVLPELDESDTEIRETLVSASWFNEFSDLLVDEDLIRRFVTTVDNVSRGEVARDHSPVTAPGERFSVSQQEGVIKPTTNAFNRYDVYVSMLTSLDEDSIMVAYQKYYPLMQEAYDELGYERPFSEAFMEAIDEVLATPDISDDFSLVSPKVMYQFSDEELESLPAAQKQLIRMGSENSAKVKAVLVKFKQQMLALETNQG